MTSALVLSLQEVTNADVGRVGGKNASLGELMRALAPVGVRVPPGFATTADAFRLFIERNGLGPVIAGQLASYHAGTATLPLAAGAIRDAIVRGEWPPETRDAIAASYRQLCSDTEVSAVDVAVRSSATAEDLPGASFAGQQETFLNVRGEAALLAACKRCYASLYTDRAIAYRELKGFGHDAVALSVGVQRMVRSDLAGSGVMFSIDTETGFDKVVLITATWGLGETVVQGEVEPDEYHVFKPLLSDTGLVPIIAKQCGGKEVKLVYGAGDGNTRLLRTPRQERSSFVLEDGEILQLARWATSIERHYRCAMDVEWAKDGPDGELYVVQARPETGQARSETNSLKSYLIRKKGKLLAEGVAIGNAVASGPVCQIESPDQMTKFVDGGVLVTATTGPDWVPIMKRAAAIITDHGGRTSHAAIVSRELGLPAVVGASGATETLRDGETVTVSCAEGETGYVYDGAAEFEVQELDLGALPHTRTEVMLNLAEPTSAYRWWRLPFAGVGLARMEFVIENEVQIHPLALARFETLPKTRETSVIAKLTQGYSDKGEYFVERLSRGLARIAAVAHPRQIIVRMSDFKSNEYASLLGGRNFEPLEENPMIGFRGASRYYSPKYQDGFALECRAIRRLRDTMGFRNVVVMIPFCRTVEEADKVLKVMAKNGLQRGHEGLQVYVMCEIPSNVVLVEAFAQRFDGFSIGSNDLTQLTLGIDRDSDLLADQFDEQDDAVKWMVRHVIEGAHRQGAKVGICGQVPSDHPEFARFLVEAGIDSISVTPDSFAAVKQHVAAAERTACPRLGTAH